MKTMDIFPYSMEFIQVFLRKEKKTDSYLI